MCFLFNMTFNYVGFICLLQLLFAKDNFDFIIYFSLANV